MKKIIYTILIIAIISVIGIVLLKSGTNKVNTTDQVAPHINDRSINPETLYPSNGKE